MTAPEFPSRAEVRATATELGAQIKRAAANGVNVFQLQRDLLDEQAKYAERFGPRADEYLDMLGDEIDALTQYDTQMRGEADKKKVGNAATMLGVLFGLFIGLPLLMRAC